MGCLGLWERGRERSLLLQARLCVLLTQPAGVGGQPPCRKGREAGSPVGTGAVEWREPAPWLGGPQGRKEEAGIPGHSGAYPGLLFTSFLNSFHK